MEFADLKEAITTTDPIVRKTRARVYREALGVPFSPNPIPKAVKLCLLYNLYADKFAWGETDGR